MKLTHMRLVHGLMADRQAQEFHDELLEQLRLYEATRYGPEDSVLAHMTSPKVLAVSRDGDDLSVRLVSEDSQWLTLVVNLDDLYQA